MQTFSYFLAVWESSQWENCSVSQAAKCLLLLFESETDLFVLISGSSWDSNDSNSCIWTWLRASVLRTADTQSDCVGGYYTITEKRFGACLHSAFFPTHCIAPSTPLRGLSTPLVMTMLQTGLLSHGALPELQFKLYIKKKEKENPWLKPVPGGKSKSWEEIDSVKSSVAPSCTPAWLWLRNPAGEGDEVAARGCGGLGQ